MKISHLLRVINAVLDAEAMQDRDTEHINAKICIDGHCTSSIKVEIIRGELVIHGKSGK